MCACTCCAYADVINLCVQQRAASRQDESRQQTAADPVAAAAADTRTGVAGTRVSSGQADPDLMDVDIEDSDEGGKPSAAAAAGPSRGRGAKSKAGMPPPAPKTAGRQRKGAAGAAAAGSARQTGLMEAFARGASQGGGAGGVGDSPHGRTGSSLEGYLQTTGRGTKPREQTQTPSQTTSRSRSAAAGSAARGRGRGSRAGGRAGRGRGRKAASEELLDSDDARSSDEVGQEGISDSDEEPPAKRARGG